jgi:hypothetical protein
MKADGLWSAYARTFVRIGGLNGSFEVHPAPVGHTGVWPSELGPPLYIITAWDRLAHPVVPRPHAPRIRLDDSEARLLHKLLSE